MLLGRVTGLERRGKSALSPVAGALGERRTGDKAGMSAVLGRFQRRPQTCRAAADDDDVELGFGGYRCPASRRIAST
jgi:hypothetical protein